MSGAIWGTPLTGSLLQSDPNLDANKISDLNNWERREMNGDLEIAYDPSTRVNTFEYMMAPGPWEAFIYEFPVEPHAAYTLSMIINAEFTTENPEHVDPVVGVCLDAPPAGTHASLSSLLNMQVIKPGMRNAINLGFTATDVRYIINGEEQEEGSAGPDVTHVYLVIDLAGCTDRELAKFEISNIKCIRHPDGPISYAQKPFNINALAGDIWNFIAVEPGAWFYSVFDDHRRHHLYLLAGNVFKLLEFEEAISTVDIPHNEHQSAPITINGQQYHALHLSWAVETVCPFPTDYYKLSEMPSDEYFYEQLTEYVRNWEIYDRGDVLGIWGLRSMLSTHLGSDDSYWVSVDSIRAILKGYTVEEYQNPYLDDPTMNDAGYH